MILVFDLLSDTPQTRKYQVTSDNSQGIINISKITKTASEEGSFSSMFGIDFIKRLALGTLRFSTNPPQHFVYGVG